MMVCLLLLIACGQSYEETKRQNRQQRREAMRRDSAALKIAVMPTLDCLPLYVAEYYQLFDTINGGVRLKYFKAQIDCDTAIERQRVEGSVTDLVRALRIAKKGMPLRYVAATNSYWQLIANHNSRIHQLKQLDDKTIAMTRFSVTDMLSDLIVDSVKLRDEHVFRVQMNDLNVRMQMLQNNEIDALWLTEPQATVARMYKHPVVFDSRTTGRRYGAIVFREMEMRRPERAKQLQLLVKAYDKACDLINQRGVKHYGNLLVERCKIKREVVDSLPQDMKFEHVKGVREEDMEEARPTPNPSRTGGELGVRGKR